MAEGESVILALFEWLNSVGAEAVQSVEDIASGAVLWRVLREIDPKSFTDELPSAATIAAEHESWTEDLNNLKYIHEALSGYIVGHCKRKLPLPSGKPDLKAIAQSASEHDAVQLLKLVFVAAIFGRLSMDYIQQLTSFPEEIQAQFYIILKESDAVEEEARPASPHQPEQLDKGDEVEESPAFSTEKDSGLAYEERIAALTSDNQSLKHETVEFKEQLEALHDRHTRLQKSYDMLEIKHKDTVERLDALRSGKAEQSILGIQRQKMHQQETVIATFESQIGALEKDRDSLKVENDVLGSQIEGFQQLQDEVYELRLEQEKLEKRANTADKYKQKLQGLQKVEEENEALKYRASEMQRQLKKFDSEHYDNSDLRRENDEYRRLVSNIERELSDSIEAKKRAEFEKVSLEAKMYLADDQASQWRARAEKLQKLLSEKADSGSPIRTTFPDSSPHQSHGIADGVSKVVIDDNAITNDELRAILSAMKAHNQVVPTGDKQSSIEDQQRLAAKIEKNRYTVKDLKQQTTDQAHLITSLRSQLDSATNIGSIAESLSPSTKTGPTQMGSSSLATETQLEEALNQKANLERELQLMASAWYHQNSRLMSSNAGGVAMSRGSRPPPEPRSFLGRQRKAVDMVLTGRS